MVIQTFVGALADFGRSYMVCGLQKFATLVRCPSLCFFIFKLYKMNHRIAQATQRTYPAPEKFFFSAGDG